MHELTVTEYKNIRVLTTQQIAEAYETTNKVISNNFARNKDRYVEGKHYICLEGEALKEFKLSTPQFEEQFKQAPRIYLWTQKGAFLHAKSLNTDKAWEVYDHLVDSYFEKKDIYEGLSAELRAVFVVDKRVTAIEKRVDHIENDMPLFGSESDELSKHVKAKGVEVCGGKQSNAYKDRSLIQSLYQNIYGEISNQFNLVDERGRRRSYKNLKRKDLERAHEVVDNYKPTIYLQDKIDDANSQEKLF